MAAKGIHVDQLAAFERIVREGSFSRAALALGLGQPAVSSRIVALEAAVGGALFTRGRRVALTALGEGFLPYVRRTLDVLGEGVAAARLAQVGKRGRVRLGALGSLAGGLVGPALAQFVKTHPEVDCMLRSGDHEWLLELLLDGIIELALIAWPAKQSAAADLTPLFVFREPVVLVVHPGHALAVRKNVTADDVARLARPLLRLRWWPEHHPVLTRLAARTGAGVEIAMEAARRLVLEGVGAGFFTRTYVLDDLARGSLVEVRVRRFAPIFRDSALVRRGRTPLSAAAASLAQAIRLQAEALEGAARRPMAKAAARRTEKASPSRS